MSRIGWAIGAGLCMSLWVSLATPGFAQTNQACVLRCLDRGHLDQYCQRVCTNGVPPAAPVAPNRAPAPAQQPAAQSSPPTQPAPPLAAQSPPAAPPPANPPPSSPSVVEPAPQPAQNLAPAQPAQNQAPSQPATAAAPQQIAKPYVPPRPVNEACVLHCLDHGHLDQYCQRVCTVH